MSQFINLAVVSSKVAGKLITLSCALDSLCEPVFDFSITEEMLLYPKSSGEVDVHKSDNQRRVRDVAGSLLSEMLHKSGWKYHGWGRHDRRWATHLRDCITQVTGKMYLNIRAPLVWAIR